MNALINLKDCKEFVVVTINNKDHQIKLAGTINDPYFCGQDVGIVLGYSNLKMAIHRYVDEDDKKYLKELNIVEVVSAADTTSMLGKYYKILSFNDGKAVYVSEAGLYNLIMSSQAPFAKEFRKLVCKVILPSIRKYGSYHIEQQLAIKDEQLNESMEQLALEKIKVEEKDKELNEANQAKDKAELKALRIKKFMNNVKIKELKLEWIYIATTDQYAKERLFKIGSTERLMSRIAPYNTGRPKEDNYYYVWALKCYNCKELDQHIQKLLTTFKYQNSKDVRPSTSTNKQELWAA